VLIKLNVCYRFTFYFLCFKINCILNDFLNFFHHLIGPRNSDYFPDEQLDPGYHKEPYRIMKDESNLFTHRGWRHANTLERPSVRDIHEFTGDNQRTGGGGSCYPDSFFSGELGIPFGRDCSGAIAVVYGLGNTLKVDSCEIYHAHATYGGT
jgi:hypothetical protein